jgi:hypothetical protein
MLKKFARVLSLYLFIADVLNAEIVFSHRTDPYATHQPVLYEMCMRTIGPIIEFGCGNGSTDMLHEICKKNKRLLVSLDDDLEWLTKFSEKYREDGDWHKFIFVPGKSKEDMDNPQHWVDFLNSFELLKQGVDVCFVDQHPWLARYETIKFMRDKARYVVLHDCDYFPNNGIFGATLMPYSKNHHGLFDFSDVFLYFEVYYPHDTLWIGPPTLIGSDFESNFPHVNFNRY